ncbi:MAG: carbamoyltransferase HypF, partial [candidate division WOR-3 bacterium]
MGERKTSALRIVVKGQVQGLGFRPYVYRMATDLGLKGLVRNSLEGVEILVQGARVRELLSRLKSSPPRLARITSVKLSKLSHLSATRFAIEESTGAALDSTSPAVDVLPDIATCPECLADISSSSNRRYRYAFTNCTKCGPRYTIIQVLPYDRGRTTMRKFKMCPDCAREYKDPADRRYHAQPNCCPECGPRVVLLHANGTVFDDSNPIATARNLLLDGRIVAVKGLGGYHVACDATLGSAVAELRRRKEREHKPLAIMAADVATAAKYVQLDARRARLLELASRPIVLLPKQRVAPGAEGDRQGIAGEVAPGINCLGVMLPYAPLHHLLLEAAAKPGQGRTRSDGLSSGAQLAALVMTSANTRDEPIITELNDLITRLGHVVDYILDHDRPIANACDDSVVFPAPAPLAAQSRPWVFIRRARGHAPAPVFLHERLFRLRPVFACGAEQKNTFALGQGNRVYLSPHIGDLASAEGMAFFSRTLDLYRRWYRIRPEVIACDLHPDYLPTRFAENLALKSHRPLVRVQHHHAHIASVMAEHGLAGPVLGIALDGTGLGTDGRIWGCELLLTRTTPRPSFERLAHLRYLPLVGGESVILEPERTLASYIVYLFGAASLTMVPGLEQHRELVTQLSLGANVVFTSSTGRLFDAVSALLGICRKATYDGQAPAMLEAVAHPRHAQHYFRDSDLVQPEPGVKRRMRETTSAADVAPNAPLVINPKPWLSRIIADLNDKVPRELISRRFHTTFVTALYQTTLILARRFRVKTVCLSGGAFQTTPSWKYYDGMVSGVALADIDEAGAKAFYRLTSSHVKKCMAILLDDEAISAPVIQSAISERGLITGRFPREEVDEMVRL